MTRCVHCGASLKWFAGQTFQVCWSCGEVTKRVETRVTDLEVTDCDAPCRHCNGSGIQTDDGYSMFACPFCRGKRVTHDPVSGQTIIEAAD